MATPSRGIKGRNPTTIEKHVQRDDIDRDIIAGVRRVTIARRYHLKPRTIDNYLRRCLSDYIEELMKSSGQKRHG